MTQERIPEAISFKIRLRLNSHNCDNAVKMKETMIMSVSN